MTSAYSPTRGRLILQHPLAVSNDDHDHDRSRSQAHVDLDSIGNELPGRDTAVGCWLNVIGYVEREVRPQHKIASKDIPDQQMAYSTDIQAIMVWSAGALDVGAYETAVRARQGSGELMKPGG